MRHLNQSLGRVLYKSAALVIPKVKSKIGILNINGSLEVTALPDLASTTYLWEQVGGVPVTMTSGLDTKVITFTCNTNEQVAFKCTVNSGTDQARDDTGSYFQFPVEEELIRNCIVACADTGSKFSIVPKILPAVSTETYNNNVSRVEFSNEHTLETVLEIDNENIRQILIQEFNGTNWNTTHTEISPIGEYSGFTNSKVRITVEILWYGIKKILMINLDLDTITQITNGASEVEQLTRPIIGYTSNREIIIQSLLEYQYEENQGIANPVMAYESSRTIVIQSLLEISGDLLNDTESISNPILGFLNSRTITIQGYIGAT